MFRKKLTPSCIRRCAVFLAFGGALAMNLGRAQGGLALESSSDDHGVLMAPEVVGGNQLASGVSVPFSEAQQTAATASPQVTQVSNPAAVTGPGLTGENWFQGVQEGVDQAFDSPDRSATTGASAQKDPATALDNSVKANAIPSLPSFWSGLTCCLALVVAGMFPRVRRVLR